MTRNETRNRLASPFHAALLLLLAAAACSSTSPSVQPPAPPIELSTTAETPRPPGLGYDETLAFAVTNVEAFWETWLPQIWRTDFEPVAEIIP